MGRTRKTFRPRARTGVKLDQQAWNERYQGTELVWSAEPNRTFADEARSLPPGRALDLAAGEGRNAVWLAERGWAVTAVDFSDVALAKATRLAASASVDLATVVRDLADYVPPPQTFDLVAVIYLQLPSNLRTLVYRRAAEAVAPGGTLVVLGHDTTNPEVGYGGPRDVDVLFSPDDVCADIGGSGLTVEKATRIERIVDTPDGERTAIDALVTARRFPRDLSFSGTTLLISI